MFRLLLKNEPIGQLSFAFPVSDKVKTGRNPLRGAINYK